MQLDKVPHNRETETHASELPAGFLIRLSEAIKDVWKKFGRNPLTCITDNYFDM
jgi:hypothetical protein